MNYKDKYKYYKKKYLSIKPNNDAILNNKKIIKKSNDKTKILNKDRQHVYWLIDEARKLQDDEDIFLMILKILEDIISFAKFANIKTIISIGDSPSIFFKILDTININNKINIKYLPISGINLRISDKFLSSKLKELNDIITDKMLFDKILWVDFLASGNTFLKFHNNLPKRIKDFSYYYCYGYPTYFPGMNSPEKFLNKFELEVHNLLGKLKNEKKLYYLNIPKTNLFQQFIRKIIGNSDNYFIRCVKKSLVDSNYKIELYNDIPLKYNTSTNNKYCMNIVNGIIEILENSYTYNFDLIKENILLMNNNN